MLGYDWPRLHAALNDLPAILLPASVMLDLVGLAAKRASLRTFAFWTLLAGVAGAMAAAGTGLLAAGTVAHSDEAHELIERHQLLGLVVLGLFAVLAIWRVVRRRTAGRREDRASLVLGLAGVVLVVATAHVGGRLVFEHALGIPSATLRSVLEQREAERHEHWAGAHDSLGMARPDSAPPRSATPRPLPRADSAPHHHD